MELRLSNMVAAKGLSNQSVLRVCFLLMSYTAISDAVRTSLGPRGMDKMVANISISSNQSDYDISLDPNFQRRSDYHERWGDHPQKHPGFASCCQNGEYSYPFLAAKTTI
jgi:hypothetical protein